MMRLLSIGIDCVSAAIFVIPALAILQCTIYRKWEFKPFCVKLIFAFYALALFSVVGVPAVGTFQMDFGLNLIPFADIVNKSVCIYEKYDFEYHFIYTDGIFCTCGLEEFPVFQNHVFHGTRGITGD